MQKPVSAFQSQEKPRDPARSSKRSVGAWKDKESRVKHKQHSYDDRLVDINEGFSSFGFSFRSDFDSFCFDSM